MPPTSPTETRRVIRRAEQHVVSPTDFRAEGLTAHEAVGPLTDVRAVGPVLTLHDARMAAGAGIDPHPHQRNERLFYVLSGSLHHRDVLNGRQADARSGSLAIFTEGRRGMIHAESNPAPDEGRQWILVVAPQEPGDRPRVQIVDADAAGRNRPGGGVTMKVLVGEGSPATPTADVRLVADLRLQDGAVWEHTLAEDESVLAQPIEGPAVVMGERLGTDDVLAVGPADPDRLLDVAGDGGSSRVLVAVTGPGYGFVVGADPDPDRAPVPRRRSTGQRRSAE